MLSVQSSRGIDADFHQPMCGWRQFYSGAQRKARRFRHAAHGQARAAINHGVNA